MQNAPALQERPSELITLAIEKGADLEKLEKLLDIQMKYEANQARKEYHKAMAAFKENPPQIEKTKPVSFGQGKAAYKHATLYNVTQKISAALSKHGLSASWTTKQNGSISVTCKITHLLGHSEETTLSAPSDKSGSKNDIQAIGSTITYLERYTLLGLCGLATFDSDDDGQATTAVISADQLTEITDLIKEYKVDAVKFCEYMKVESLDQIKASEYQKAVTAIKAKGKK